MNLSRVPLSRIRSQLADLPSTAARQRWLCALRADGRRGAAALADRLERRLRGEEREARRMEDLFARQLSLHAEGAAAVAGVDEVGVGPLAGPVVAAAVILPVGAKLPGLDDSKRLKPAVRQRLEERICEQALATSIGAVSPAEIDERGIYSASLEAMRRAVVGLSAHPDHLLVDARTVPGVDVSQTAIVRGDASEACIAAASIIAKVHRDSLMCDLHRLHPGYGFDRHKGYGTRHHLEALQRLGPSPVHRRSFAPVAQWLPG